MKSSQVSYEGFPAKAALPTPGKTRPRAVSAAEISLNINFRFLTFSAGAAGSRPQPLIFSAGLAV